MLIFPIHHFIIFYYSLFQKRNSMGSSSSIAPEPKFEYDTSQNSIQKLCNYIIHNDLKSVQYLLDKNVSVTCTNSKTDLSAVEVACMQRNVEMLDILLSSQCVNLEVIERCRKRIAQMRDEFRITHKKSEELTRCLCIHHVLQDELFQ